MLCCLVLCRRTISRWDHVCSCTHVPQLVTLHVPAFTHVWSVHMCKKTCQVVCSMCQSAVAEIIQNKFKMYWCSKQRHSLGCTFFLSVSNHGFACFFRNNETRSVARRHLLIFKNGIYYFEKWHSFANRSGWGGPPLLGSNVPSHFLLRRKVISHLWKFLAAIISYVALYFAEQSYFALRNLKFFFFFSLVIRGFRPGPLNKYDQHVTKNGLRLRFEVRSVNLLSEQQRNGIYLHVTKQNTILKALTLI